MGGGAAKRGRGHFVLDIGQHQHGRRKHLEVLQSGAIDQSAMASQAAYLAVPASGDSDGGRSDGGFGKNGEGQFGRIRVCGDEFEHLKKPVRQQRNVVGIVGKCNFLARQEMEYEAGILAGVRRRDGIGVGGRMQRCGEHQSPRAGGSFQQAGEAAVAGGKGNIPFHDAI